MKPREFLLGESVNGWYIKELGTKDFEPTTFLDAHCLKVREIVPIDWDKLIHKYYEDPATGQDYGEDFDRIKWLVELALNGDL